MNVYYYVCACPGCGAAMDQAGFHALTCQHLGSFGVRHNALRETFLQFLSLQVITVVLRKFVTFLKTLFEAPTHFG